MGYRSEKIHPRLKTIKISSDLFYKNQIQKKIQKSKKQIRIKFIIYNFFYRYFCLMVLLFIKYFFLFILKKNIIHFHSTITDYDDMPRENKEFY
jgi:hypothetical protein